MSVGPLHLLSPISFPTIGWIIQYSKRLFCFVCPDDSTKGVISEEQRRAEEPKQPWIFVNHLPSFPLNNQVKSVIQAHKCVIFV